MYGSNMADNNLQKAVAVEKYVFKRMHILYVVVTITISISSGFFGLVISNLINSKDIEALNALYKNQEQRSIDVNADIREINLKQQEQALAMQSLGLKFDFLIGGVTGVADEVHSNNIAKQ